jgi:hypothetical protein
MSLLAVTGGVHVNLFVTLRSPRSHLALIAVSVPVTV